MEFQHFGVAFMVIERGSDSTELRGDGSIIFVQSDASKEETLTEARTERAKGLVAVLRQYLGSP